MTNFSRFVFACVLATPILQTGCGNSSPPAAFSRTFLEHVAANAPAGQGNCYVNAVQHQWANEQSVWEAANKVRVPRGEADVVNFAIKGLHAACSLSTDSSP